MTRAKAAVANFIACVFALNALSSMSFAEDAGLRMLSEWEFGGRGLDFAKFDHVPQGPQEQECGTTLSDATSSPTYGRFVFICRRKVLAHGDDGKIWRFEAKACRHGGSANLARHHASADVQQLIFSMFLQAKSDVGVSEFKKDREYERCAPLGSDVPSSAPRPDSVRKKGGNPPVASTPPPINDRTLRVSVRSLDSYIVHLKLHSKDRGHEWPGNDEVYVLKDSDFHTYEITCEPHEKVCYGAGRDGNYGRYWGIAISGEEACTGCCMTCGGVYDYTLNAGPDDSSNVGGVLSSLGDLAGAMTGLAGAVRGSGGGSGGGGFSRPTPSYHPAPPNRASDITGTR